MVSLNKRISLFFVLAIAMLLGVADHATAQQVFGRIFGTVTDATGGAVANAKVTITDQNKNTSFDAMTNESGNYERNQLLPSLYSVTVEATGFSKQQFKDIRVEVDNAARVDSTLQPGNVTSTVEVTAAAPTLQADRADVATTFTAQQLVDLPSLGRNAQAYELLTPGTQRIGFAHASSEDPQGSAQIAINGQHFSSTGYQLDGTVNQDPILGIEVINPNIDSLAEQKISSQDYDAEFGYVAAGIVNASTKSGSNQFHFSAFDYLRNNSPGFTTSARDPFAEPNGALPYKQNQFGGSIGGKIIKDKLFFFGDAELIRLAQTGSVLTTVLTQAARNGDFSSYLGTPVTNANGTPIMVQDTVGNTVPLRQNMIFDPTTGNPTTGQGRLAYANNQIPTAQLSKQAQGLLNAYLPLPNVAVANPLIPNYAASGALSRDANKWDTRIDYFQNEKTSFYGRYSNHQFTQNAVGAFGNEAGGPAFNGVNFAGNAFARNQSYSIGTTHSFGPTLINEFRFGYMRYNVQTTPNGVGTQPAAALGIAGVNLDNYFTSGLPYFNLNQTSLGYSLGANQCNCPLTEDEGQYQFTDNVTKIVGNHNFKFGADVRYAKNLRVTSDSHRAGEFTFSNADTGFVPVGAQAATQGLNFATFLLGNVTGFNRYVSTSLNASEHQRRQFYYGQDTWRASSKLTITLGLRWELVFPEEVNGAGNGAELDLRTGMENVFGIGNVSTHGYQNMNWLNFAPRLGIAYQLNPKTVIRAGYGWSYGLGTFGATFGHNVTQNPPVLTNQQINAPNSFGSVFTLAQGPNPPASIAVPNSGQFLLPNGINGKARPLDIRMPRTEAYNLTVERQIAPDTSVSVAYVGNVGRHVAPGSGDGYNINVNQPYFAPGVPLDQRRPYYAAYGWTQGIDFYCMCNTNAYNSLQVQLNRRFKAGYGVQASYTFQDAVSDNSDAYTLLYNRALGRGRENAISDHALTIAQNFQIPFGRGRRFGHDTNRIVDAVAGGWDLAGVTVFYSGLPFTPNLADVGTAARPDVGPSGRPSIGTGSPYATNPNRNDWLASGPNGGISPAFLIPADNTFGNYGFNTLRGPIFINQDINLSKSFALTERLRYTLRGEAYNIFNHTNLGLPSGNVNGSNPGQITAIAFGSTMRRLQFAMRLDF